VIYGLLEFSNFNVLYCKRDLFLWQKNINFEFREQNTLENIWTEDGKMSIDSKGNYTTINFLIYASHIYC